MYNEASKYGRTDKSGLLHIDQLGCSPNPSASLTRDRGLLDNRPHGVQGATQQDVQELRRENGEVKQLVADL